jgi:hypothetical protein
LKILSSSSVLKSKSSAPPVTEIITSGRESFHCRERAHEREGGGERERKRVYQVLGRPCHGNDDVGA